MDPVLTAQVGPLRGPTPRGAGGGSSRRPSAHAWNGEINRLMHIHEHAGMIPLAEFARSAAALGVSRTTVATRFAETKVRAGWSEPVQLSPTEIALVSDSAHFGAAIARLRENGCSHSSVALERALWAAPGLRVAPLLGRERIRRRGNRGDAIRLAA